MKTTRLERIEHRLKTAPAFYPYLLALWFVLEAASRTPSPSWGAATAFFAGSCILIAGVRRVFSLLSSDAVRSSIATLIVLLPVFCFQETREFLATVNPSLSQFKLVVPLFAIVVFAALIFLRRPGLPVRTLHGAFNMSTILFVVWAGLPFFHGLRATAAPMESGEGKTVIDDSEYGESSTSTSDPDIYFIILDAYTSNESLTRYWSYDNAGFTSELSARGFFIADSSRSHYTRTVQSVASILGMDSLRRSDEPFERVRKNPLTRYFRSRGYDIVNLSPFDIDGAPAGYSYFTDGTESVTGLPYYFYQTGSGVLVASYGAEQMPDKNIELLSALNAVAISHSARPRFVYAHIMAPHGPFGFNRDGKIISFFRRGGWNSLPSYLDQLVGLNGRILPVLDTILAHSGKEPVIILQGDHGSRIVPGRDGIDEAHTILNAYHLPGVHPGNLSRSLSPENSFRIVLNSYFGRNLPLVASQIPR